MLTRLAGLASDNIISVKGVDGRGRIVTADARQNSDLLWAARGAPAFLRGRCALPPACAA